MPAKRPPGDAVCVWLIVETLRTSLGWKQEAAFAEISAGLVPLSPRKRGIGASFDVETGKVVGDKLSPDRIESLY
jgi:hypothetical protein